MKSFFLSILSFLLVTGILSPAVIVLIDVDEKRELTIDFNEEEKKEEKKETTEKEFFFSGGLNTSSSQQKKKTNITGFYLDSNSTASVAIFLHPPRRL